MTSFKMKAFVNFVGILSICFATSEAASSINSIKLENGQYNGLTIGIDGDSVDKSECRTILQNLTNLLPRFSELLYHATEGRAYFGPISLLIPRQWSHTDCGINASSVEKAEPNLSYHNSHIQLTETHPMTGENSLPWTRQYRPCGQSSDSIFIARPFLSDSQITDIAKAQILLHEWTKFRYGAFDEIGYDNADLFSSCYALANRAHLTCCSNSPQLNAVANNASVCTLEFLLQYQKTLREQLEKGVTSVMSSPNIESVAHFCNESTHNPWSPTKQNLYCERRSVAEVINSHSDFNASAGVLRQSLPSPPPPELRILQHQWSFDSAYAFVIEDSPDMRDSYKLQHVKQAIAQMLDILEYGTHVFLFIFTGDVVDVYRRQLSSDDEKRQILNYIPNTNSKIKSVSTHQSGPSLLSPVIEAVVQNLGTVQISAWNVFLFANSLEVNHPVNDMISAVNNFQDTPHSMSVFTFENKDSSSSPSDLWLRWYDIPNTKNVVALPYCSNEKPPYGPGGPCNFLTSSFILDHFVGTLNGQPFDPRFLQIPDVFPIPVENQAGQNVQFQLPTYEASQVKRVFFFMSIPENDTVDASQNVRLIPPTAQQGGSCTTVRLLEYSSVLQFTGQDCIITGSGAGGQWTIQIVEKMYPGVGSLLFHVWIELEDSSDRLMISPSLSVPQLARGISPNQEIIPAFVALQTPQGFPVLDAQVSLHVSYPSLFSENGASKEIILRDDGLSGADQTGNDGVYSAYLNGFSPNDPAFHLVQLKVTTTADTKIMQTIEPPRAILMDEKITGKCCGKHIRPKQTTPYRPGGISFQTLHLGFKTLESWSQPRFPPERVGDIKVALDGDTSITVEFTAVAGDSVGGALDVSAYEACCIAINETSELTPPETGSCKSNTMACDPIQSSGSLQTCSFDKQTGVNLWVPTDEISLVSHLICAIVAINTNSEIGLISQKTFTADVRAIASGGGTGKDGKQSCETFSLSDKCLPIWIFWVLIGCVGLLLLLLVIVAVCWCCANRKKKQKPVVTKPLARENVLAVHYTPPPQQTSSSSPPDHSMGRKNENDDPKVVNELFVNHAYIQDGDGEIKIIADNGQILRKPLPESGQNQAGRPQVQSPVHRPILSVPPPMASPSEDNPNMQVFKPVPMPKPNRPVRQQNKDKRGDRRRDERPQIIHSNPMLRSDSTYNLPQTTSNGLPPQQQYEPPPPPGTDPALVYATISRRFNPPNNQRPVRQTTFDPHYQVPHNSTPATAAVLPQPSQRHQPREPLPRSPPQMPNYPTTTMSESESSSDYEAGQRSRRMPPRFTKPPPYPAGSQFVRQNNDINPTRHYGGRGGGATGGPPPPPPVPPPRYDRSVRAPMKNQSPAIQNFSNKQDMMSTDDDDSDEWDDGDNYGFDNTTGVSYA